MGEWQRVQLGELINIKHGYAFPGSAISTESSDEILVTPGNFNYGGGFKLGKLKYFHDAAPSDYVLRTGDLVVTMTDLSKETDTLGYSAKIPNLPNKRFLHNQRIGLVTSISERADLNFLYWVMRTNSYQGFIAGSATGMSVMHTSPTTIRSYEFEMPPLPEQQAIAEILSSLDDKIDLLHRQNKTLESLAQTLFRQWFIEEAEDSWEMGKLGDVISIYDSKRIPVSAMERDKMKGGDLYPYYGAASIMDFVNDYIFDGEYLLMGEDGTVQTEDGKPILQLPTGKFWVNNHAHVLQAKEPFTNYFLYIFLQNTDISHAVTGAVQPKINQENLKAIKFPIPQKARVAEFVSISNETWNKIKSTNKQIQSLTIVRDALLPKLMSGEVTLT